MVAGRYQTVHALSDGDYPAIGMTSTNLDQRQTTLAPSRLSKFAHSPGGERALRPHCSGWWLDYLRKTGGDYGKKIDPWHCCGIGVRDRWRCSGLCGGC